MDFIKFTAIVTMVLAISARTSGAGIGGFGDLNKAVKQFTKDLKGTPFEALQKPIENIADTFLPPDAEDEEEVTTCDPNGETTTEKNTADHHGDHHGAHDGEHDGDHDGDDGENESNCSSTTTQKPVDTTTTERCDDHHQVLEDAADFLKSAIDSISGNAKENIDEAVTEANKWIDNFDAFCHNHDSH